ncbi:DedA family protein, partial [Curtobacterium sp. CT11-45]|uniref:DedA family protein n=1 Tax=Curtobacterium sp. CT11-45 TaxID=3243037 RepID=UPI0039B0557A
IVAGIARMKRSVFIRYSLISAFLWSTSVTLLGFFLGRAFPQIKDYLQYFIIGIVIVSVLPGVWQWLRTRRKHRETI